MNPGYAAGYRSVYLGDIHSMMQKRWKVSQKRILFLTVALVLILIVVIFLVWKAASVRETHDADDADPEQSVTKTEYSREEKALMESQTGVTVDDKGTVEVDIGAVLAEEASVPVSRGQAEEKALSEAGEGFQIETLGLEKYKERNYWVAGVSKEDEARQIWIDAETGEVFIDQKE